MMIFCWDSKDINYGRNLVTYMVHLFVWKVIAFSFLKAVLGFKML